MSPHINVKALDHDAERARVQLDCLPIEDRAGAEASADKIVLDFLRQFDQGYVVAEAYERLRRRARRGK